MHAVCHQFVLSAWPLRVLLATAGASKCKAPPPSMVAAVVTRVYGCIWNSVFVSIVGLMQRIIQAIHLKHGEHNQGVPKHNWAEACVKHTGSSTVGPRNQWHLGTKLTLKGRLHARVTTWPSSPTSHDLQSFWTPWSCWSLCCLGWKIEAQTSQRVKGSRVGVSGVSVVSVALQKDRNARNTSS